MKSDSIQQQLKAIPQQFNQCLLTDVRSFYRQLNKINKQLKDNKPVDHLLAELQAKITASAQVAKQRQQEIPPIQYADELPVSQKKVLIQDTISNNQVTIICGETGSGKTTQLPKMCLQLGLGSRGLIGHTQPRRLAASSVANRIAEELNTPLGQLVGYKVRFNDKLTPSSHIKLMTDGILLAEIHHDPYLNQYDTIIIDEAHERSLNIDFLLGYLKRLLPKRRDLKIIITSATIDPQRFSTHFNDAPIIEVSGRTFPVEVHYRPLHEDDQETPEKNLQTGIADAVDELTRHGSGDILVFLSGERDIRETADYLSKQQLANTEILPLLARLSSSEQNKIFHTSDKRRIILATNIAETSLTVPGIKYVIDSGMARISRYSWRSKIQRLPIEKISQASANQRKGRCGRISAGVCIRLYSEDDFNLRDEFTEPEIQRTNLASVILQMENMQLGHVDDFPFVEPPEERLVNDGYKLLFELGAINDKKMITDIGKKLARLPIDPKLGRILLEADKESVLSEMLIIVSALSIQDPRDRPMDWQQAADEAHKKFIDNRSDFLAYLNIWQRFNKQKEKLSGNKLRRWCKDNFLSWLRMREWQDTHKQIKQMLNALKLTCNKNIDTDKIDYPGIHKSLITGLISHIGLKSDSHEYLGTRNRKFNIFPGSALFSKTPKWLVSAEIVETSRVYARINAKIEPQWIEQKAQHLLKYNYLQPHWEKRSAQVSADRRSLLFGLIINPKQKINYGPVDPAEARKIFITSALVQGDFNCKTDFFVHNQNLIIELEDLEAKSRRQDILVDDDIIYQFYDNKVPDNIYSGPQFNKWIKSLSKVELARLYLTREDLMQHDAETITATQFPDHLEINGARYPLDYHFNPNHQRDGITLVTPAAGLASINAQRCEWLVPGLLHEKMVALIRSLPKQLRRHFVPAPNYADACMESLCITDIALTTAMSNHLKKMTGIEIPYDAWRPELLDQHLMMNYRVIANDGSTLAEDRDLQSLQEKFSDYIDGVIAINDSPDIEQDDVDPSILDNFPEQYKQTSHGVTFQTFPALNKEGKKVALRLYRSQTEATEKHKVGLRQLYINQLSDQIRHLKSNLNNIQQLCLHYSSIGTCDELKADIIAVTIDRLFTDVKIESADDFQQTLDQGRSQIIDIANQYCHLLTLILSDYQAIKKTLKNPPLAWLDAMTDIQEQLNHLLLPHFLTHISLEWLEQYPRYLQAISKRLDKIQDNPERDRKNRIEFSMRWQEYLKRAEKLKQQAMVSAQLNDYRWMLEEYRVSLFAQELKTRFPISAKRLKSYWSDISDA